MTRFRRRSLRVGGPITDNFTDERLIDLLAARVMGRRAAPDGFVKPSRSWTPRSSFRPLADIRDAFRVLDAVTADHSLLTAPRCGFTDEVRQGGRVGRATAKDKARAISLAVAKLRAIGIEAKR